jgi:predicted AAA+ superfamily ATPase
VDWTGLGEVMDADRRTAEEYVRLLASLFALLVLYREDPRRGGPMLRAHKKLYPADPLLGHLPARIAGGPAPSEAGLVEALITATLFRSVEQEGAEAFFLPRSLFYWRSQAGGEVDAVVGRGRERLGVEVKYRDRVDERELAGLKRSFRRGLVITRGTLSVEDVPSDRKDPEGLELARGLLDSLPPSRREELEREAAEQFGDLDPEELQKAVLELVARRSFGPARLGKYGL